MPSSWTPGPGFDSEFADLRELPSWRSPSLLGSLTVWSALFIPPAVAGALVVLVAVGRPVPSAAWALPASMILAYAALVRRIRHFGLEGRQANETARAEAPP